MPNNEVLQRVRDGYVSGKHTTDYYISDAVFYEAFDLADERGMTDMLERIDLQIEANNSICTFLGQEEERDDPAVWLQNYEDDREPCLDFIVKNILDKVLAGEHYRD